MHRIVLDSNVIISGIIFGGNPRKIIEYALQGSAQCFISLPILDEIMVVLQRPKFNLQANQILSIIEELHALCRIVTPKTKFSVIDDDPDDNKILDCAYAAAAETIISGDSHLLNLIQWKSIRITTPAEFADQFISH